jgi:uncharacterized damage-inducible protein DinB
MATPDLKAHLVATTRDVYNRLVNDLKAIPADKQNVSPGGCARAPLTVVAECAAINGFAAQYLATGQMPGALGASREEREAFLASFDTEEKTLAYLAEQTDALVAAFEQLDVDTLGDTTDALGRPMSRLALAQLPAQHMAYHDGQLNLVHGLCGDNQMHWG